MLNDWDTCQDQHTLGLFCRHGNHHPECIFYTKSQTNKYEYVREVEEKSNEPEQAEKKSDQTTKQLDVTQNNEEKSN